MITIDPISISVLGLIAYQLNTLSKKIKDTNKRVDRIHQKVKEIEVVER